MKAFTLPRAVAAILLALALAPSQSVAASATANFNVTVTVLTSCSVSASDLAFGTYDAATVTDHTGNTTISVTCSLLTPYTLSLNTGANAQGSTRRMGSGASRLAYEIYRDPAMTNVFGTVAAAAGIAGVGTGFAVPTAIYGKIPKNQAVIAGNYADALTVTIDY